MQTELSIFIVLPSFESIKHILHSTEHTGHSRRSLKCFLFGKSKISCQYVIVIHVTLKVRMIENLIKYV